MKGLIAGLAVFVVLGFAFLRYRSPTSPAEMTEAERAQIEAGVMEWAEAWFDVWRGNDCELSRPLIHPTRSVFVFQGKPTRSIDDWMNYCGRSLENRASWSGSWTDIEIRVLSADAAEFVGTYSATITYRNDTPTRHYPISTQITNLERTATGWGMTHYWYQTGPPEAVEEG